MGMGRGELPGLYVPFRFGVYLGLGGKLIH